MDSRLATAFVPARWKTVTNRGRCDLVVIHDMEAPEKGDTAENVARYFQNVDRKASAHYNVDNNSIVQCVLEKDVAYHAPGANHNGIGIEHAGYARQSRGEWTDLYGLQMLDLSVRLVADICSRHAIPLVYVDANRLKTGGARGITTHAQVSLAWRKTDHMDPGLNFPMDEYVAAVERARWDGEEDEVRPEDIEAIARRCAELVRDVPLDDLVGNAPATLGRIIQYAHLDANGAMHEGRDARERVTEAIRRAQLSLGSDAEPGLLADATLAELHRLNTGG